jgi:hypothetical protein
MCLRIEGVAFDGGICGQHAVAAALGSGMFNGNSVIIFSMKSMYVWLHLLGTDLEPLHRAQERPVLEAVGCCVELLLPSCFAYL